MFNNPSSESPNNPSQVPQLPWSKWIGEPDYDNPAFEVSSSKVESFQWNWHCAVHNVHLDDLKYTWKEFKIIFYETRGKKEMKTNVELSKSRSRFDNYD